MKVGAHIQIIYKTILLYGDEGWGPYTNYIQNNIIVRGWRLGPIYKLYTKQYYCTGMKVGAHIQIIYKTILLYGDEDWGPYTNYIQNNIIVRGWRLGPIYKLYTKQYYCTGMKVGAHIQIIYKTILLYGDEGWGPYTNYIQNNIIVRGWRLGPIYKLYTKQYYCTGMKIGAHIQIIYKTILLYGDEGWGPYTNYIQSNIIIRGWRLGPIYKLYTKQCYCTGMKVGAHIQIIYKTILLYGDEDWGPYTNYIQNNIIVRGWRLGPIYKLYTKQYYCTGMKIGAHIQIIYKTILLYGDEDWGPYTNYIQNNIIVRGWRLGPIYKLYTKQCYCTGMKIGAHIQIIYKTILLYGDEDWGPYTNYIQSNIIVRGWRLGPIYKLYTKQYYCTGMKIGAHIQIIYKTILLYGDEDWGPYTNYIQSNIIVRGWRLGPYTNYIQNNIIVRGWRLGPIYKLYTKQYYCNFHSSNIMRGELGVKPLLTNVKIRVITYIKNILQRLMIKFWQKIKIMFQYDYDRYWKVKIMERPKDISYCKFKHSLPVQNQKCQEQNCLNTPQRLSNHNLRIETGRHVLYLMMKLELNLTLL